MSAKHFMVSKLLLVTL